MCETIIEIFKTLNKTFVVGIRVAETLNPLKFLEVRLLVIKDLSHALCLSKLGRTGTKKGMTLKYIAVPKRQNTRENTTTYILLTKLS